MNPSPRITPTPRRLIAATACAFTLAALPALAQTAPVPAPENKATTTTAAPSAAVVKRAPAAAATTPDEVVILSPFEVVGDTQGYYAANTMSGTRMNSKIEDLGQSITVMTKEMMVDFAMLDINDVFDYMASTEGTSTYSQFTTDRTGAVVDNVSLSPNTANRVRGIGSANIAFNNIATTGRVPVDTLWMDSLELSRGPNANIFGLGNASGTVNQVPATANLYRDFTKADVRADSHDGWRASIDVNRMLLKDKFAMRVSYANQHTGFIRKPSGEDARRLSFQVKVKPAKNTTISYSYYDYKNSSVRPNFTTPRDYYTDWLAAGRPGWNPVTRLVTLANGQVYGNGNVLGTTPYVATATPVFFAAADSRSIFQIGAPGEGAYWAMPRYTNGAATNGTGPFATTDPYAASYQGTGLLQSGAAQFYSATQQPLFNSVVRPIADQSIYDWTTINLAGNSKAWDDVKIHLAQLDQIFLNTPKHTLAAQLTVMREDAKRLENQPMGPASVNGNVGQLQVDVNQVNLDGTPNPYFGRPFLKSSEPYLRDRPQLWDTARVQTVYKIDFTQDKGWSKWLGTQQLLGYYEYKDQQNRTYTYRHSAVGYGTAWEQKYAALNAPLGNGSNVNTDSRYLSPTGTLLVPGNYSRIAELYYVGSTPGGGIEYAPSYFPEGASLPYVWGPSATTLFHDVSAIGFTPSTDKGGGLINVETVVKTKGGVLQSTFLGGRLVGTFGLREDIVYDRNAPSATLTPDLRAYDFAVSNRWNDDWRMAKGKTKTASVVARPFRDLRFLQSRIEGGSGVSRFLAEAVSSFSLTYNKADNFIAQGPAYDLFLNPLPNQTGTSKDIGFWMTMLDGKLSLRYTHFDTKQLNLRDGDINTMAQRVMRFEGFAGADNWNLKRQVPLWLGETASAAQIAAAIQMPIEQYNGLQTIVTASTYAAVMDSQSKGDELEVNFNPTKAWTVSASVTKTEAINTAAGTVVDDYIAARMPIWTTLEDPRFKYVSTAGTVATYTYTPPGGTPTTITSNITAANPVIPNGPKGNLLWWNIMGSPFSTLGGYNGTNSAATNFAGNVDAPMSVFRQMIGRPRPQMRKYSAKFNTKYNLSGITSNAILKSMSVGGSLRYATKGAIGFYGLGYDPAKDLRLAENRILQLDTNRPIYSPAETYVDLFVTYSTKLYRDKVRATFQLNVKNVFENGGGLQATDAFLDGTTKVYRIVDPRQFILSASFDL